MIALTSNLYTKEELAEMWCRLNEGKHPLRDEWKFNPINIPGAMALLTVLIGPSRCMQAWRKRATTNDATKGVIERRRYPRD